MHTVKLIMSSSESKRCVIGIRGQTDVSDTSVDIWFDSLKSLANVLSPENQKLLKCVREQEPKSLTELACFSGRAISNVCRTLKKMEKHGLIKMTSIGNSTKVEILISEWFVFVGRI